MSYISEYMLNRYYRRRKWIEGLFDSKCNICGKVDGPFDIDHIDNKPSKKSISKIWNYRVETILKELKDCQLLCEACHAKKTTNEKRQKEASHGTLNMYQYHKCRCIECREANRLSTKRYRGLKH